MIATGRSDAKLSSGDLPDAQVQITGARIPLYSLKAAIGPNRPNHAMLAQMTLPVLLSH